MTKKATPGRLREAILETAGDMRRLEIMDEATHEKITLRQLGKDVAPEPAPITGEEIQAVFARYLNLTVGYVSQLERGAKRPRPPWLDLIRRMGLEAIL